MTTILETVLVSAVTGIVSILGLRILILMPGNGGQGKVNGRQVFPQCNRTNAFNVKSQIFD